MGYTGGYSAFIGYDKRNQNAIVVLQNAFNWSNYSGIALLPELAEKPGAAMPWQGILSLTSEGTEPGRCTDCLYPGLLLIKSDNVENIMRRTQNALFLAGLLFGSLSLVPAVQAEGETTDNVPPPPQIQQQTPADAQPSATDSNAQPPLGPNAETPEANSTPEPDANADNGQAPASYDLNKIIIDYKEYKVGDSVPQQYQDKSYNIVEWQKRNLPAPDAGSHWTYIGGNYLLISDDAGKILKAESGDIFFRG